MATVGSKICEIKEILKSCSKIILKFIFWSWLYCLFYFSVANCFYVFVFDLNAQLYNHRSHVIYHLLLDAPALCLFWFFMVILWVRVFSHSVLFHRPGNYSDFNFLKAAIEHKKCGNEITCRCFCYSYQSIKNMAKIIWSQFDINDLSEQFTKKLKKSPYLCWEIFIFIKKILVNCSLKTWLQFFVGYVQFLSNSKKC